MWNRVKQLNLPCNRPHGHTVGVVLSGVEYGVRGFARFEPVNRMSDGARTKSYEGIKRQRVGNLSFTYRQLK